MIASYVGENKEFERQYLTGELEVELTPQGTLAERLRAGGMGIPAFYTETAVNTLIEEGGMVIRNGGATGSGGSRFSKARETKIFDGRKYLMECALKGDLALVKAWRSDERGNLQFSASARNFNPLCARAAVRTVAEVEEIVPVGVIDPNQVHLPGIFVDKVFLNPKLEKQIERIRLGDTTMRAAAAIDEKRERIVRRLMKEFQPGMCINLGIGIPMLVSNYMQDSSLKDDIIFQSENGILGLGPFPSTMAEVDVDLINAGKESVTVTPGASFFASDESFGMIRGGRVDLTVLGGMEVSTSGDLANWIIPGKMVKGMGGAMDLAVSPARLIVAMQHVNSKTGRSKIVKRCSLPITGTQCVDRIITDLAVLDIVREGEGRLKLIELQPGVTLEELRAKSQEIEIIV